MSRLSGPWRVLGVAPTTDVAAIRRAYADALKKTDVDADPQRFQALMQARTQALAWARRAPEAPPDDVATGDSRGIDAAIPVMPAGTLGGASRDTTTVNGSVDATPGPESSDYRITVAAGPPGETIDLSDPQASIRDIVPPTLGIHRSGSVGVIRQHADNAADIELHRQAVMRLLFETDDPSAYLSDVESIELKGHVDAVLADPRLDNIDLQARTQAWFADVAAAAIPRSDPIMQQIVDHFGWTSARGRIDQSPAMARCVSRRDSLRFFDLVQQPGHSLHKAWQELTNAAGESTRRGRGVKQRDVTELLQTVRKHFPDLEGCFDTYRVDLWTNPHFRRTPWWGPWAVIVAVGILLRIAAIVGGAAPPDDRYHAANDQIGRTFASTLGNKEADIERGVMRVAGGTISYAEIREQNPRLDADLTARWQAAVAAKKPPAAFEDEIAHHLARHITASFAKAPYDVVRRQRILERDELAALADRSPEACDAVLKGGALPMDISERFSARRADLAKATLLDTFDKSADNQRAEKHFFRVPANVMDAAAERAGMKPTSFIAALKEKGSPGERCAARIALLHTALRLQPSQGEKLLREI